MAEHNELGRKGERVAADFLRKKGLRIVETNWHYGHEELDIIAYDGETLVVVEVKTRQTDAYGNPETAVTKRKQRSIVRAANAYVVEHDLDVQTRFDVVSVVAAGNKTTVEHFEDAFYPLA